MTSLYDYLIGFIKGDNKGSVFCSDKDARFLPVLRAQRRFAPTLRFEEGGAILRRWAPKGDGYGSRLGR